jgi:hypothetical protein
MYARTGVCFVVAGCNVAFEIVHFDDGLKEKERLVALERK